MICIQCGATVPEDAYCPVCGSDLKLQTIACHLSNQFYNQGLDKAQIRDLSGAISLLRQSLKYNKRNIHARNLLGLVYYETGEAVSALSEWVISKNIKPDDNIASEYIEKLQADPEKLNQINESIKKYNLALACCRDGNEDVAAIQLKKILRQNRRLIKAYHLLALIFLKNKDYKQARRVLRKALKIDKTNSTSLRFMKEIDEQTGTVTTLDNHRRFPWQKAEKEEKMLTDRELASAEAQAVIQPVAFRETSAFAGTVNIIIGLFLGVLLACVLAVPTVRQQINRDADERILGYSATVSAQEKKIEELEKQMEDSNTTVDSAKNQISKAENQVKLYENLVKANQAYQTGNAEGAMNLLTGIDSSKLSVEGITLYNTIYNSVAEQVFQQYFIQGVTSYNQGQYTQAYSVLEKAHVINPQDYNILTYLAHSYRLGGETDKALKAFGEIVQYYPNTRRATVAQQYIDLLNSGNSGSFDNPIVEEAEGVSIYPQAGLGVQ
ncbi:MAG: tetratricopeptide repeat protein [Lachnospiraceae bacterium]|nr:tetratricopeptide repeat protein [Lachnospiraceae bacterium]